MHQSFKSYGFFTEGVDYAYGWIMPMGGASSGRVCACSLRSRLFFFIEVGLM